MEIDLTNIKTVLKVVRDRVEPEIAENFLIRGSRTLDINSLRTLARAGTIESVLQQLGTTSYHFLSTVPEKFISAGKISELEKELDRYLIKKGVAHFLGDPLSIAIGLGYIWAKVNEVTNIRIIAWGKTTDVSEKELREALLHV
jgi:V/A-type H+-transporting ATPase subunit C